MTYARAAVDLYADNHIHTRLCNHASGEMEEYVLAAIERGLHTITFLEHMEAEIWYFERTWLTAEDFSAYFIEGSRLREIYQDQISIRLGVEVGWNPRAGDMLREGLANHSWDLVGLSYHFLFDGRQHLNMVSRRKKNIEALATYGPDRVLTEYFDGLIQGIKEIDCDVLCHLDAVLRHSPGLQFKDHHWQQIENLLQLIRRKGVLLELNTSGFSLRGSPYPGSPIIRRARELGIGFLAGSDAHRPDQVGRDFNRLPELLTD